jgi:hypothetical protein
MNDSDHLAVHARQELRRSYASFTVVSPLQADRDCQNSQNFDRK